LNDNLKRTWLITAFLTMVLMISAPLRPVLIPLIFLNTHIHELAHAIGALITGGVPARIEIFPDGSGTTPVYGGIAIVVGSAGYLGASVYGALMVMLATDEQRSQRMLLLTAFLLVVSLLALVRGPAIGTITGFVLAVVFTLLGNAKGNLPIVAAQFVGLQQCLNSLNALLTVMQISGLSGAHSDARILQSVTGVPALAWAVLWTLASVALMVAAFRRTFSEGSRSSGKRKAKPA